MILTTHALTGAIIGKSIHNPWIIIITSITIHFAMDHLRHGEYVEVFNSETGLKKTGWKIALDIILGLSVIFSFIALKNPDSFETRNILMGSFFSMFPDLITFFYWLLRWRVLEKYYLFHSWIHKHPKHSPERQWTFRNAANDILISCLAITILFFRR